MREKKVETGISVRINTVVTGELAKSLVEWKNRGIIKSYTDGVLQGLRAFGQKLIEQDLMLAKLRSLQSLEEEY